jgi:hypothetical protein
MSASRTSLYGLVAVLSLGMLAAGCGGGTGLSGAKTSVLGHSTAAQSPDMPERPKLAMPVPGAPLPVPGEAPARTQWTATVQQPNQQAAATPPKQESSGSWYSGITGAFTR